MSRLTEVKWDKDGLVPAVSQDCTSGKVLTLAWMNEDALKATIDEGRVVYWSRSRKSLWRKGEQSGFIQKVRELRLDCVSLLLLFTDLGGRLHAIGQEVGFWSSFSYRPERCG